MRTFEQQMLSMVEKYSIQSIKDLPPEQYAVAEMLSGAISPKSPWFPWVFRQIHHGPLRELNQQPPGTIYLPGSGRQIARQFAADPKGYLDAFHRTNYWSNKGSITDFRNAHHDQFQIHKPQPGLWEAPDAWEETSTYMQQLAAKLRALHRAKIDWRPMNVRGVENAFRDLERKRMRNSGKVVHKLPNGWTIRRLRNNQELQWEGDQMANCIGDYSFEGNNPLIYSLRDEKNRPKVSMEFSHPPDEWGVTHKSQIDLDQIEAKAAENPKDAYKAMIKHWFDALRNKGAKITREGGWTLGRTYAHFAEPTMADEYGIPGEVAFPYHNEHIRGLVKDTLNQPQYEPDVLNNMLSVARSNRGHNSLYNALSPHHQAINAAHQALPPEHRTTWEQSPYYQIANHLANGLVSMGARQSSTLPSREHVNFFGEPCQCGFRKARKSEL